MKNFEYYTPTRILFGKDVHLRIGELLKAENCRKVLVHYGSGSVVRSGLLDAVLENLSQAGVGFVTLGGAVSNPRLSKVREGIALCRREQVDFLLAIGGGSVIDSCKAIGYGAACPETDVWKFFEKTAVPAACLPIGVILTIPASGSEMSGSCVITNEDGHLKRGSTRSDLCRPRFALLNPELTYTLSPYQTECGCVDILMHTLERYLVNIETMELTDSLSESLMQTVICNARILLADPGNYNARAEIMWAGSLSHNGLMECGSGGGDWACHQLAHELGGIYDVPHGAALSAIWGTWARYVYKTGPDRFAQLAVNVFDIPCGTDAKKTALAGIGAMEDFFRSVDMPTSLSELGLALSEEEIHRLAFQCSFQNTRTIGSFQKLDIRDMENIYRMAR